MGRINKDLVDAVMMLSFIILVLVGTTDFESIAMKNLLMGGLGTVTVIMVILRFLEARQSAKEEPTLES